MIIIDYTYSTHPQKRFVSEARAITIGRAAPDNVIDLDLTPDTSVSRRHAHLTFEDSAYWISDLDSKSGTYVNERRIKVKTRLSPGDKVRIGLTLLQIFIPNEGILTKSISATIPAAELMMIRKRGADSLDAARHRLLALYELGIAIGTNTEIEPLLKMVVDHLVRVIIDAQRAVILLFDETGTLVPRAYVPAKTVPSVSANLVQLAIEKQEALTWRYGTTGETGALYDSVVRQGTQAAMYAPLIWNEEILGVLFVDNVQHKEAFDEDDLRLLMAIANQVGMFIKNRAMQQDLLHQELVRSNLLRQFSPQVAERLENLLHERDKFRLGGERAEPVTILNSDVRGFTALTANMEPNEVVQMLNELFSVCIPIIFKYNGTVDKYVGDAILAVFGSPEPDNRQWEKAVNAALEMQKAVDKLGRDRARRGLAVCKIGIGIHTGAVLHGFIGSEERMEFTVIGDTVNRVSRYCSGAGPGEVIISHEVHRQVASWVKAESRVVKTKHSETEGDLEAFVIKGVL
ncbi:MAG: adenylate/guanylate cyclase domain-containing protein [Anaerolineae bacterium]|nr:adenylate/guanylate cyclase domain-containing protein [Anaerolineae bacterium]